jgi:hypothetical protein
MRSIRNGIPQDLGHKKMKLKQYNIWVWTRGDMMTVLWREKMGIHKLPIIQSLAESNLCNEEMEFHKAICCGRS